MLCIRLVLFFAQNRVYTWFIGCLRFGVDGDAADLLPLLLRLRLPLLLLLFLIWFLMLRYESVCTQILWSTTVNIQLRSHNAFFRSITFHHRTLLGASLCSICYSCCCSIWCAFDTIRYDMLCKSWCVKSVWVCLRLRVCASMPISTAHYTQKHIYSQIITHVFDSPQAWNYFIFKFFERVSEWTSKRATIRLEITISKNDCFRWLNIRT